MKNGRCAQETAVLEALRSGRWETPLREHASSCAACRDTLIVSRFMRAVAGAAADPSPLPAPGEIWLKARLLAGRDAAEKVLRPIAIAERAAFAAVGLTLLASAIWLWPHVQAWLSGWGLLGMRGLSVLGPIPLPSSWILGAGAALLISSVAVTLYDAWAAD